MKKFASVVVALAVLAGSVFAEDLKSGLQKDSKVGPFYVTKVAGPEDGVTVGQNLCYRCKYGAKPQVMVFARTADDRLATLVKKLDETVGKNEEKQLKAFVNIMADSKDAADASAKAFAAKAGSKNVPIVVPNEFANGPDNYGLNPKADLTVLIVSGGTVVGNHAYEKDAYCESCIESIVKDVVAAVK
ncbi:MAG: hypothetical protein JNM18_17680 [Planctomycetaceae bacterium]|nr:hypothetical protein [Planctomycetaceae bacterium]